MTATERDALHEWVLGGYSVHENGSMASTESGEPCDFLDVEWLVAHQDAEKPFS